MKRILIVDDNEISRVLIYSLLENYAEMNTEARFSIHEAANGLEAVILAEDAQFDMILMDINMPGMDGIEATRRIRQYNPRSIIVAVSAMEDERSQKEILYHGADDYIFKPVDPADFYARIRRYLLLAESRM